MMPKVSSTDIIEAIISDIDQQLVLKGIINTLQTYSNRKVNVITGIGNGVELASVPLVFARPVFQVTNCTQHINICY